MLLDLENIGIAIGISLLSGKQAKIDDDIFRTLSYGSPYMIYR